METYVIDSGVIFLRKAFYENMVTIPEVIEEIKDEDSKFYLSLLNLRVEDVEEKYIERIVEGAKKTGDIHRLSKTDIKLIAKAIELIEKDGKNNVVLLTDDYSIQNLAMYFGIRFENVVQKTISKAFKWVKVCKGCGRKIEDDVCPVCGSEAILRRVKK
ncbi:ribonuclease VapC [Archaeoglobales archaeon]|nr:MAG: ribonuclease VapC [Archaeoglobales archaeon]